MPRGRITCPGLSRCEEQDDERVCKRRRRLLHIEDAEQREQHQRHECGGRKRQGLGGPLRKPDVGRSLRSSTRHTGNSSSARLTTPCSPSELVQNPCSPQAGLTATDLKPRIGQAKKGAVPGKERPKSREETPKKGCEARTGALTSAVHMSHCSAPITTPPAFLRQIVRTAPKPASVRYQDTDT
jgi:hypothetical protein